MRESQAYHFELCAEESQVQSVDLVHFAVVSHADTRRELTACISAHEKCSPIVEPSVRPNEAHATTRGIDVLCARFRGVGETRKGVDLLSAPLVPTSHSGRHDFRPHPFS